ncbi:MAG: hypothetical protein WC358_01970 [Ignavibacteria bacterium]|jgi:hypothetical protein
MFNVLDGISTIPIDPDWRYVTDPYWRSSYKAPSWIYDIVGKDSTASMQKVVEILDDFYGELMSDGICYAIKLKLLPFLGDRCLTVDLQVNNSGIEVIVAFDDDDGLRKTVRLD